MSADVERCISVTVAQHHYRITSDAADDTAAGAAASDAVAAVSLECLALGEKATSGPTAWEVSGMQAGASRPNPLGQNRAKSTSRRPSG